MWLKCCCCPKQRWATQMAAEHQASFSPSNKGGNWGLMNSLTAAVPLSRLSVTCLKSFPLLFILFPLYLSSVVKKWPPGDFLNQGRNASQMWIAPVMVIFRQLVSSWAQRSNQREASMFYQWKSWHTVGDHLYRDFQPSNHQDRCLITVYNDIVSKEGGEETHMSFKNPLDYGKCPLTGNPISLCNFIFCPSVVNNLASSVQFSAVNLWLGLFY